MPKRKRDSLDEGDRPSTDSSKHIAAQRKRASEKIHHSKTLLHRALKLAKGFERQKLSRRQKNAAKQPTSNPNPNPNSNSETELQRIAAEIEALKTLDLVLAAESHLHKTLNKEKAIATSPVLPEEVKAAPRAFRDRASVNVAARLFNAKCVKDVMGEIVPAIRAALGVRVEEGKVKSKAKGREDGRARPVSKMGLEKGAQTNVAEDVSDEEGEEPLGDREELTTDVDNNADADEDDDFTALDAKVAGSSDEEDENGMEEEEDTRPFRERTYSPSVDSAFEDEEGDSGNDEDVEATEAGKRRQAQSPEVEVKPAKKAKAPDTTFLPSLTMGGYWSGSESEAEDINDIDIAPRKNRRGQRARQQIWEKKYGKGAKHLQQDTSGKRGKAGGRDDGWDAKKGARDARPSKGAPYRPAWAKAREDRHAGSAQGSGGNATALGKRKGQAQAQAVADKPLHPSWEAAKKAKEAKKMDIAAFSGKKMTFD